MVGEKEEYVDLCLPAGQKRGVGPSKPKEVVVSLV